MPRLFGLIFVTYLMFTAFWAKAQDTVNISSVVLDSLVVKGNRYSSPVKEMSDGSIVWKMKSMEDLPKLLGNSDPIHYTQMLPGIGTNAEYQGGIHVQGCDNSHNNVSINGVPIYNVNHLLGFFSIFNASHYSTLSIRKNLSDPSSANRLGGELDMQTSDDIPQKVNGEIAVGLISSQGTVKMPIDKKTALTLSARVAYINMLYGNWLKVDDKQTRYSFSDCNATFTRHFGKRNVITADFYTGSDNGSFHDENYLSDIKAKWGNVMGALHWLYKGRGYNVVQSLYATYYHNSFQLLMQNLSYSLPSSIFDIGYKGQVSSGRWNTGLDAVWHDIRPQYLDADNTFNVASVRKVRQQAVESSAYIEHILPLRTDLVMKAGIKASVYSTDGSVFGSADPSLSMTFDNRTVLLSASCYLRHQYLFQTGFSNSGFPTEFWMSCSSRHRPQYAYGASVAASAYLRRRMYRVSAEIFYKRLFHQVEYNGNILDLVNTAYSLDNSLIHGDGANCGFSIMLNKCSGNLKGWIAYSYTNSKRRFAEFADKRQYPSSHERPHELTSVVTYDRSGHWSFGGNVVFASGTPFTAPLSIEFINGNIVSQYGSFNGNRLKPYFRIDASANYKWKTRRITEHGINISLYNVTCRKNDLFYRVKIKKNLSFAYKPLSFFMPILPSISYFCKF